MTWYLRAVSTGISLMMEGSILNCARLMGGNTKLGAEQRGDFFVFDEPQLDEVSTRASPRWPFGGSRPAGVVPGDSLLF
jgi:hypothetical protein